MVTGPVHYRSQETYLPVVVASPRVTVLLLRDQVSRGGSPRCGARCACREGPLSCWEQSQLVWWTSLEMGGNAHLPLLVLRTYVESRTWPAVLP